MNAVGFIQPTQLDERRHDVDVSRKTANVMSAPEAAGRPSDEERYSMPSVVHAAFPAAHTGIELFPSTDPISGSGSNPASNTLYRMREGIERFAITDINNPAASARAQSDIFVMMDVISAGVLEPTDTIARFNHVPGGANVLYMDGHVEFTKYPGEYPVTPCVAKYLGGDINGPSQPVSFSVP